MNNPATTINTLTGAISIYNQNLIEMEKEKLTDEKVVDDGRRPYNILNFQDFVLEEGKKNKEETKKSKKLVKNCKEFIEDKGDDVFDPNECPERFIKIREQFIKEDYK
ncbi:MAG: hypothetical protein IKA70_00125 [Alistipes sp.]|nr:hypothetical protein [Alistipes sp.]